jgi:hypothetical protein
LYLKRKSSELQSSNAELQSSNAELQSSNAELQSSNAELQSSNAELQSSNLELAQILRLSESFGKPVPLWGEETPQTEFLGLIKKLRVSDPGVPLVRLGSPNDGGYVIPDLLPDFEYAFSAGVADNSDFEYDLAESGIPVNMIDFSVQMPARTHELFQFSKVALAPITQGSSFISLEDWVSSSGVSFSNMLLKMDIEGAEWRVLYETPDETLARFEVVIVEFHWFESVKDLWAFGVIESVLTRLLKFFDLIHVHGNNHARNLEIFGVLLPEVAELTFLRKKTGIASAGAPPKTPGLDKPNNRHAPEIKLDGFWGT